MLIRLKSQAPARQMRSDDSVTAVKAGVRKTPLARSYIREIFCSQERNALGPADEAGYRRRGGIG